MHITLAGRNLQTISSLSVSGSGDTRSGLKGHQPLREAVTHEQHSTHKTPDTSQRLPLTAAWLPSLVPQTYRNTYIHIYGRETTARQEPLPRVSGLVPRRAPAPYGYKSRRGARTRGLVNIFTVHDYEFPLPRLPPSPPHPIILPPQLRSFSHFSFRS